jgi:hypothetical protein
MNFEPRSALRRARPRFDDDRQIRSECPTAGGATNVEDSSGAACAGHDTEHAPSRFLVGLRKSLTGGPPAILRSSARTRRSIWRPYRRSGRPGVRPLLFCVTCQLDVRPIATKGSVRHSCSNSWLPDGRAGAGKGGQGLSLWCLGACASSPAIPFGPPSFWPRSAPW